MTSWTEASFELEEMHDAVMPVRCPRCGVAVGERCVNPATGKVARVPCLARFQAVDAVGDR